MFDKFKDVAAAMGQAKELKQNMQKLQDELGQKTVEADAGAGAVRVVANGNLEILSVRVDRAMLVTLVGAGSEADHAMVEDLITAATNAALTKARDLVQQQMAQLTGGLNLPGLDKMLGE